MAKVSGSYESVVRGVSQQVPQDRRSGQHTAQTNFINDPVRGLARRHGSILQHEQVIAPYSAAAFTALLGKTERYRATTFYVGARAYDFIARTDAQDSEFAYCFDRTAKRFIPVQYASGDSALAALRGGGVSAACNLGKYLVVAGNTIIPAFTSTPRWESSENARRCAVWIRGGAYSRTFAAKVTMGSGFVYSASYKTKAASYPGILDTSDLNPSDPNYQKLVNDRTNAYNSAATAWIGQAAEDATPQNIAAKLATQLAAAGLPGVSVVSSTIVIDAPEINTVTGDDGGDDSLIHAVAQEVAAPELVSAVHWVGKVVKVRPKRSNGDDAFYLEAVARDAGAAGWANVSWRETAGTRTQPTSAFVLGTVKDGVLYLASSAAAMQAMTGYTDVPSYKASECGDALTAPVPYFLGRRVDYLGVFQDRLEVGCDATIMYSRSGDYFNWFRQSVLTVADDDPVEQYALGSEFDRITGSAMHDRNRIYFGDRYWYSVSGLQPLTPRGNGIVVLREEPGANRAPPKASDNLVFYCKREAAQEGADPTTKLMQVQAGLLSNSPEGTDISGQLDDYLAGEPLEVLPITSPNTVVVRTSADRQRLYTYTYLDAEQGGQRLFDAWGDWSWLDQTGHLLALSRDGDELLVYVLRHNGDSIWVAAERFSFQTGLSRLPYADSLRPYGSAGSYLVSGPRFDDAACAAFGANSGRYMIGVPYGRRAELVTEFGASGLWVGIPAPGAVTPTNPYMRDREGRGIVAGRLTLSSVQLAVADTAGFVLTVDTGTRTLISKDFNARILGKSTNQIGKQPVVDTTVQCLVGKEIRECSYTIHTVDWLPLTLTGLGWTGQYFNNTRRVG